MNNLKFSMPYCFLFLVLGLSIGTALQSQTVVQWYTSMGDFRIQLREDLAPNTSQNFIDLTEDEFYDDLIFHRVIIEFMIQDGCPYGTGTGGPGYTFDDEFHPDLRHDEPGILSMANSGPNTNGSQYFITVVPTDWLDDVHSVFGKVMDGMEVVYDISLVDVDGNSKPYIDVNIDSIRVVTGDPQISLTSPVAGIKMNASIDKEITWDSEFIADVKIELSTDNGQSWTEIVESTSANTRSFSWPALTIASEECLIKISDVANPDVFDVMEDPFTLARLDLLSPSGFGFYRMGSPVEILWESEMTDELSISYKTALEDDWILIEDGVSSASNSYLWTPTEVADWCRVQIRETAFPDVADESENYFLVFQLDLTSPEGGENLSGWGQFDINWETEIINAVKIEFSSNDGQTWYTIDGSTPVGSAPYTWIVPNINSEECYIRLSVPGLSELYSINELPFSIEKSVGIDDPASINKNSLAISPNPVRNDASVSFYIQEDYKGGITVEIISTNGEVMVQRTKRTAVPGDHSLVLKLNDIPAGLYILKLTTDNSSSSIKFIKNGI